jgi:hypothetical protein
LPVISQNARNCRRRNQPSVALHVYRDPLFAEINTSLSILLLSPRPRPLRTLWRLWAALTPPRTARMLRMLIPSRRLTRTPKTRRSIGLFFPARLLMVLVLVPRVVPLVVLRRSRGMQIGEALACALRHEARRRRRRRPTLLLALRLLRNLRVVAASRASASSSCRGRDVASLSRVASSSRRGYQRRGRLSMLWMR